MIRRDFLTSLAASAALSPISSGAPAAGPEFYLLRRYRATTGPHLPVLEDYLSHALLPALQRLGCQPAGAFRLLYGPETPTFFVLIPNQAPDLLSTLDLHLAADPAFMSAAAPFWSAPAGNPPFTRLQSSLHQAFSGWPRPVPPPAALGPKRILQLRTYESPTYATHLRKVEMFNNGEFAIFQKTGCNPVFFAQDLIAERLPSLTYMLSFSSLAELDAAWTRFGSDPDWKKLSSDPRYSSDPLVSNISNLVLAPLTGSAL